MISEMPNKNRDHPNNVLPGGDSQDIMRISEELTGLSWSKSQNQSYGKITKVALPFFTWTMENPTTIILILAILSLSTFVRSALGFGDALIAMPLLALVVG